MQNRFDGKRAEGNTGEKNEMKRRINIEVSDDSISLEDAVKCVAAVIGQGRISNDGNNFCYATRIFSQEVSVWAKVNKPGATSQLASSDSFFVLPDKQDK
jgi:hypothetical protein